MVNGFRMDNSLPPLPEGYTLDNQTPALPPGFTLDSAPAEQKPKTWRDVLNAPVSYAKDYLSGIKSAGNDIKQTFKDAPIKSTLTAPAAMLEPVANFVGGAVGDASAVLHSAIDKVPGSFYVGDFDPNATFAQRRQEYRTGIGKYTDPQTRVGQDASNALGAVFKPVGDVVSLPGRAVGGVAKFLGASDENAQSLADQTTAIANAALLAKSVRKNPEPVKAQPIPEKGQLKAAANEAYKKADQAGAVVKPQSFTQVLGTIQADLVNEGINPKLNPATTAAFEHISQHNGPLSIKQLETYRKVAQNAEKSAVTNPADARLAGRLVSAIDNYMESLSPKDLQAGDAAAATNALKEARGLWSRYRKTDVIDEAMQRAELRASQFSGSGLENAIRTEFRQLAMNKKKMRGFNPEEQAAIKKVASGGPIENGLRMLGKAAPTGVVSAALGSGAGFAAAGPVGAAAVPAAGAAARFAAGKMTMKNAARAQELMRAGPNYIAPPPGPVLPFNVNPLLVGGTQQEIKSKQFADFVRSQ